MPARPLLPGNYDSYAAARAAKLGRNRGRKRSTAPKPEPLAPDNPPSEPAVIPHDSLWRQPREAEREAHEEPDKSMARQVSLAQARAAVKDRILGPVEEIAPEQAKEVGTKLLQKLVPRAIRVIHFNLDHGPQREQLVAAMDVLDRAGFHKGPAVQLGNGPLIMINVGGGPLPWEGKPAEIDVTPKR